MGDPQLSGNTLYEDIPIVLKGLEYKLEYVLAANTILDLSSNNPSGQIPESIGNLSSLRLLNLSGNQLEGDIPASLGRIWTLEQLDLSKNKMRGHIPKEISLLSLLAYLNLSSNRLCGQISKGMQLETFTARSFQNNLPCLCGGPLQSCSTKNQTGMGALPSPSEGKETSIWSRIDEKVSIVAVGLGWASGLHLVEQCQ
ncbi:hypothetical protein SUGI_0818580 [Cryptomeria japonica]|uniref:receptor-like protein 33 n=1 Tax=Cryptomeria japonica TaxID=3369 RepID=UPI0024149A93|nr:receptor-like protein 33 [Cryptomeria japonica]GLJ40005.1 hypothetical protein SUGI_0818580 [Cryptomeria japonica]